MPKIIAAGVGLPLIGTGATVTTSQPLLDLSQTWNNAATAFTGLKFNVTDTASANLSLLMDLQVGGVPKFNVGKAGVVTAVSRFVAPFYYVNNDTGAIFFGASLDTVIQRDGAANTLALRNGTAAQQLNIYETYTDASNYSRGFVGFFGGTTFAVGADATGTGTGRSVRIQANGTGTSIFLRSSGTDRWQLDGNGHFIASTDNTYDIGASGANRPRDFFLGRNLTVGGDMLTAGNAQVGGSGIYFFNGRSTIRSPADATVRLTNFANTITTDITLSGASGSGASTATFGGDIAAGAVGTVKQLSAGMLTTTARFRERVAVDMLGITTNLSSTGFQDNAALSSWQLLMGATSDVFRISRSPPGSGVLSTLFSVGSTGNATLTGGLTTDGSVVIPGASGYFFSDAGSLTMPMSGGLQINDASATNTVRMTAGASNLLTLNGGLKTTGATFALQTATTLTDNAAAQVATMTNGPTAGNPTKWIAINDNGTTRYIPAW